MYPLGKCFAEGALDNSLPLWGSSDTLIGLQEGWHFAPMGGMWGSTPPSYLMSNLCPTAYYGQAAYYDYKRIKVTNQQCITSDCSKSSKLGAGSEAIVRHEGQNRPLKDRENLCA